MQRNGFSIDSRTIEFQCLLQPAGGASEPSPCAAGPLKHLDREEICKFLDGIPKDAPTQHGRNQAHPIEQNRWLSDRGDRIMGPDDVDTAMYHSWHQLKRHFGRP